MSTGRLPETLSGLAKMVGLTALATTVLDQLSKKVVVDLLSPGDRIGVISGVFDVTLVFNKGAAFGLFSGVESDVVRYGLLAISTIIALLVLVVVLLREYRHDRFGQAVVGLVLGGAIGNIIDRVRLGQVIDFLDFYIGEHHWPAFNVADSAICVGVILLLIRQSKGAAPVAS